MKNLVLFAVCLLSFITHAQVENIGHGNYFSAGFKKGAFLAHESAYGEDFDGDGMLNDSVLHFFDFQSGQVVNTGIKTYQFKVATDGKTIVFLQHESNIGEDKTGDGDRLDVILSIFNIETREVTYTSIVPYKNIGSLGTLESYTVHGNIITFIQREYDLGVDVNQNGHIWDRVICYYNITDGSLNYTPIISNHAVVENGIIVSRISDGSENIIVAFDTETNQLTEIYHSPSFFLTSNSAYPSINSGKIVWSTSETHAQVDFNADGNLNSSTNGIMIHNLSTSVTTFTGVLGNGPVTMKGDIISYETYDYLIGLDINQDGDLAGADKVLALYNSSNAQTTYIPRPPKYSLGHYGLVTAEYDFELRRYDIGMLSISNSIECTIVCDIQGLVQYVQAHQGLSNSQSDSLIEYLEAAVIAINGSMQGYIHAIESMDIAINNIWQSDLEHEIQMELVDGHFRGVKNAIHELYNQTSNVGDNEQEQSNRGSNYVEMFESMMALTTDAVILNELTALIAIAQSSEGPQGAATHLANIITQLESTDQTNSELYQMISQFQSML